MNPYLIGLAIALAVGLFVGIALGVIVLQWWEQIQRRGDPPWR